MRRLLLGLAIAALCAAVPAQEVKRELIYGAELMTRNEREAYRQRLERARTAEDADKVRAQHRVQLQKRARARGETLDERGLRVQGQDGEKQKRERKREGQ